MWWQPPRKEKWNHAYKIEIKSSKKKTFDCTPHTQGNVYLFFEFFILDNNLFFVFKLKYNYLKYLKLIF